MKKKTAVSILQEVDASRDSSKGTSGHDIDVRGDGLKLVLRTYDNVTTAAEAMDQAGLDADVWEPIKVRCSSRQVTVSATQTESGVAEVRSLISINVECKRREGSELAEIADVMAKRARRRAYKLPAVQHRKPRKDPSRLVVGLVDHHWGKLAWQEETGTSYDLKTAGDLFARAIRSAVDKCAGHDVSRIYLPVGNDFCNVDNRQLATEHGTSVAASTVGRYEQLVPLMEESLEKAVTECRSVAPVSVIWVGGNHDRVTSYFLCRCLAKAFRDDKHVDVDTSACPVKYLQFGKCLIGLAHGDAPKQRALVQMMPIERADDWAKSTSAREWLTGHTHQQKTLTSFGTHEASGQVFRILPSLCGTDSWHYHNGFSMSRKATENYLYSEQYGLVAMFHESAERLGG